MERRGGGGERAKQEGKARWLSAARLAAAAEVAVAIQAIID